ncbi:MAG: RluA family pseudouridine synthase [Eubacteriales bacterium]|nr:RluA family pseudouridine synthase [Eubacteriales bacterium]
MNFIYNSEENKKQRLDSYLSEVLTDMSRSHIQGLIKDSNVLVNGKVVSKAGASLTDQDEITVNVPEPESIAIVPEDIPLDIVYEDNDVIVVNKPKGMVVHPANGHYSGTLVNALMYHCRDSLSGINGELRPGIVHRIDMDTTGLIIACKNDKAHNAVAAQLAEHSITRKYYALVYNNITEDEGTVDANIDRSRADRKMMAVCGSFEGKTAVTHYRVLERFPAQGSIRIPMCLVECRLDTGRTHQIRVHMSHIGHPLAGDEVYGIKKDAFKGQGQYLHAAVLGFTHPSTGERLTFEAPLPEYFAKTLSVLKKS